MSNEPLVRIRVPCEWMELRNNVDNGMPVKGIRATLTVHGGCENECACAGLFVHTTGAFHPLQVDKCHEVDRTAERDRAALEVMGYMWKIPFGEQLTTEEYELFFQCYMMVFSGGEAMNFCEGSGPTVADVKVLDVARQQARRVKLLGAKDTHVYARPKLVVWRDSVVSAKRPA